MGVEGRANKPSVLANRAGTVMLRACNGNAKLGGDTSCRLFPPGRRYWPNSTTLNCKTGHLAFCSSFVHPPAAPESVDHSSSNAPPFPVNSIKSALR
jgi:hypothetical protein